MVVGDRSALGAHLSIATARLNRQLRGQRNDGRLTLSQVSALLTLGLGGPMTPGELATAERVRPPSMTRVLTALVGLGYVDRVPHPTDRRRQIVAVSRAGREHLAARAAARDAWMDQQMQGLNPSEVTDLAAAVVVLNRIIESDS